MPIICALARPPARDHPVVERETRPEYAERGREHAHERNVAPVRVVEVLVSDVRGVGWERRVGGRVLEDARKQVCVGPAGTAVECDLVQRGRLFDDPGKRAVVKKVWEVAAADEDRSACLAGEKRDGRAVLDQNEDGRESVVGVEMGL